MIHVIEYRRRLMIAIRVRDDIIMMDVIEYGRRLVIAIRVREVSLTVETSTGSVKNEYGKRKKRVREA